MNVADVALMFGGGGHQRAAGVLMQGTREQVKEKLVYQVKSQIQ